MIFIHRLEGTPKKEEESILCLGLFCFCLIGCSLVVVVFFISKRNSNISFAIVAWMREVLDHSPG